MALDTERLIAELQAYESDPMWADHAEVPKRLLKIAADEILALHVAVTVCVDGGTHDMVCQERDRLKTALQMMVDHMFGPCASDMSRVEIEVLARSALQPLT